MMMCAVKPRVPVQTDTKRKRDEANKQTTTTACLCVCVLPASQPGFDVPCNNNSNVLNKSMTLIAQFNRLSNTKTTLHYSLHANTVSQLVDSGTVCFVSPLSVCSPDGSVAPSALLVCDRSFSFCLAICPLHLSLCVGHAAA